MNAVQNSFSMTGRQLSWDEAADFMSALHRARFQIVQVEMAERGRAADTAESAAQATNNPSTPCHHHVLTRVKAWRCDKCGELLSRVS